VGLSIKAFVKLVGDYGWTLVKTQGPHKTFQHTSGRKTGFSLHRNDITSRGLIKELCGKFDIPFEIVLGDGQLPRNKRRDATYGILRSNSVPPDEGTLGRAIFDGRQNLGISQSSLASRVGVTQTRISAYERNAETPHSSTLTSMKKYFGWTDEEMDRYRVVKSVTQDIVAVVDERSGEIETHIEERDGEIPVPEQNEVQPVQIRDRQYRVSEHGDVTLEADPKADDGLPEATEPLGDTPEPTVSPEPPEELPWGSAAQPEPPPVPSEPVKGSWGTIPRNQGRRLTEIDDFPAHKEVVDPEKELNVHLAWVAEVFKQNEVLRGLIENLQLEIEELHSTLGSINHLQIKEWERKAGILDALKDLVKDS